MPGDLESMTATGFFRRALASRWLIPAGLLVLCALSFGPLIFSLGLYWDDWPSLWFLHFFGPGVFPRAFAADRPVQGWLFVLTTSLVGESLLAWQVFGILTRWLSGLALGWLLISLWPERKAQCLWVTVLFLLYPGFMQQYIPITYGHQFLILSLFLLSQALMVWSVRKAWLYGLLTLASLLTAVLTMFALEYFYGLELLRPVFIFLALGDVPQAVGLFRRANVDQAVSLTPAGQARTSSPLRRRLWLAFRLWLPYLVVDALFLAWRLTHSTPRGEVTLFNNLRLNPSAALADLVRTIVYDIYESALVAWARIFTYLNFGALKLSLVLAYLAVAILSALLVFLLLKLAQAAQNNVPVASASPSRMPWGLQALLVGLYALLIAGWPVWVTDLRLELAVPWDRFTQLLMLGACLALVGLLDWLIRPYLPKIILVSLLAGLAAGAQFHYAFAYRLEWNAEKQFFWQFAWRVPALQPGTLLLSSNLPFFISTDNSLTAAFNWIYAPDLKTSQMPFLMYDLYARLGNRLPGLSRGIPIHQEYRATEFDGSTSQALLFYYNPPRCLKLLDYTADSVYPNKPDIIAQALPLSRLELILPGAPASPRMPALFGPEPPHDWCYYFERIELAVQLQQWDQAAGLADQALQTKPQLNHGNATELLPLVTAYARVGRYDRAVELSQQAVKLSDKLSYALCDLWFRLGKQNPGQPGFQSANDQINQNFQCATQSNPQP
jgi:hypothetical protein